MARKQCPFCGEFAAETARQCPRCREAFVAVAVHGGPGNVRGRAEIRRGLLYAALAGVLHYFAAGYSGMELPLSIIVPALTDYLLPFMALCGLGLVALGIFRRYLQVT